MVGGRRSAQIKRVRGEVLVILKMVYPGALQLGSLMRSLVVLFPTLEWEQLKRDMHYLVAKVYVERIYADGEDNGHLTPWKLRWFRLTAQGVEVADHCINDPALGQ